MCFMYSFCHIELPPSGGVLLLCVIFFGFFLEVFRVSLHYTQWRDLQGDDGPDKWIYR